MRLASIGVEDVQKYLSYKSKENQISPATINRSRTVLCEMFKNAVEWGYLRENPVQYVKPLKEVKEEMSFLTPIEIEKFLKSVPLAYYAFFLTAIFTGMRRGELLAAKWANAEIS